MVKFTFLFKMLPCLSVLTLSLEEGSIIWKQLSKKKEEKKEMKSTVNKI